VEDVRLPHVLVWEDIQTQKRTTMWKSKVSCEVISSIDVASDLE
jgi:hypothetical protein